MFDPSMQSESVVGPHVLAVDDDPTIRQLVSDWVHGGMRDDIAMLAVRAPSRTHLSLRGGGAPASSPFAIDARRGDRRLRQRS